LEAVDKLLFIFINKQLLQKLNNYEPTADKLLAIEDKLIG